jgi:hypothetical protein
MLVREEERLAPQSGVPGADTEILRHVGLKQWHADCSPLLDRIESGAQFIFSQVPSIQVLTFCQGQIGKEDRYGQSSRIYQQASP